MSKKVVACLTQARERVRVGWVQNISVCSADYARDVGYRFVSTGDATLCFCASGAIHFARHGERHATVNRLALHMMFMAIRSPSVADWNDAPERTREDVLAAFDRAIELASKEIEDGC